MNATVLQFQKAMQNKELEVVLASGASNVFYLSDIPVTNVAVNPVLEAVQHLSPTVALVPSEGRLVVFTSAALKQYLDDRAYDAEVYYYPTSLFLEFPQGVSKPRIYAEDLETCIGKYLNVHTVKNGKLGIDSAFLSSPGAECLQNTPYGIADGFIQEMRAMKTEEEIRRMRIASCASYAAMERVEGLLKTGKPYTEEDLFYEARQEIFIRRCQWRFSSLMAGPYSADIYHQPRRYALKNGDVVRLDIGAVYQGYGSDVARTFFYGTPPEDYAKLYDTLCEAQHRMIESFKPGVPLTDVFSVGLEYVRAHGYPQYTRKLLGHSVGIETEERPYVESSNDFVIRENMVFSLEVPYYIKERAGFNIEDIVLVTPNGCEFLK